MSVDFGSGPDLPVCGFKPHIRLAAVSTELGACFRPSVPLSPCPTPTPARARALSLSLSLSKINKTLKKKISKDLVLPTGRCQDCVRSTRECNSTQGPAAPLGTEAHTTGLWGAGPQERSALCNGRAAVTARPHPPQAAPQAPRCLCQGESVAAIPARPLLGTRDRLPLWLTLARGPQPHPTPQPSGSDRSSASLLGFSHGHLPNRISTRFILSRHLFPLRRPSQMLVFG